MGSDKVDASGQRCRLRKVVHLRAALRRAESCRYLGYETRRAAGSIRGPYEPIATKVPGMRINEMHTQLAKLTDQFTLINSMTHPGAISNHFDAMHNLLSGQSDKARAGGHAGRPALPGFVRCQTQTEQTQHRFQCVAHQVRRAARLLRAEHWHRRLPWLGLCAGVRRLGRTIIRRWTTLSRRRFMTLATEIDFDRAQACCSARLEIQQAGDQDPRGKDWSDLREKTYEAMTRPEGRAGV